MRKIFIACVMLFLTACSSMNTSWDYNPDTNFSQFKTFAWTTADNDGSKYHLDGLMDERVRHAVDNAMQAKGLKMVAKDKADILVNYLTKVNTKVDVNTFTNYYGYNPYYSYYNPGWGWGAPWGTIPVTETQVREYNVGTLIIDIIDAKTNKLVWRGALGDIIKDKKTPEQRVEFINKAVNEILANFPPKAEK